MITIDSLMLFLSMMISIISIVATVINQRKIRHEYDSFKTIQNGYLQQIQKELNESTVIIDDKNIKGICEAIGVTYKKLLQESDQEEENVHVVLRKNDEKSGQLIVAYAIPPFNSTKNMKPLSVMANEHLVNIYINGNSRIQEKFIDNSRYPRWQSYVSFVLKEEEKIIGTLDIFSVDKINERYSYENIKSILLPVESLLISYLKQK